MNFFDSAGSVLSYCYSLWKIASHDVVVIVFSIYVAALLSSRINNILTGVETRKSKRVIEQLDAVLRECRYISDNSSGQILSKCLEQSKETLKAFRDNAEKVINKKNRFLMAGMWVLVVYLWIDMGFLGLYQKIGSLYVFSLFFLYIRGKRMKNKVNFFRQKSSELRSDTQKTLLDAREMLKEMVHKRISDFPDFPNS